jgi:hypothetical protein
MDYEFMITGTPLPPCMPLPRATLRLPVSSTAKVMYARLLDEILTRGIEDSNGILFIRFPIMKLAAAKVQEPIMQGHDLSGKERFRPETRHMITLEVQKDCFVGFKGERFRFYLSDEGYRNAKHSEQEGEIRIKSHAAVVAGKLYPDKKPRQQER